MKQSEAKLKAGERPRLNETDLTDVEVICAECGSPIVNVSIYTKRTLLAQGQIMRAEQKKSFQVECPTCATKRDVKMAKDGKSVLCVKCNTTLRLSESFIRAVALRQEQEIKAAALEEEMEPAPKVTKVAKVKKVVDEQ